MLYHTHPGCRDSGADHHGCFGDLAETVKMAVEALRACVDHFDSIVVTGVSGIVVGAPVALALGKPLVVVRKDEDTDNHGSWKGREGRVLGLRDLGTRACFIDDLVSSGSTRAKVQKAIAPEASVDLQYTYERGEIEYLTRRTTSVKPPSYGVMPAYDAAMYPATIEWGTAPWLGGKEDESTVKMREENS
jgi:hypothetical protein